MRHRWRILLALDLGLFNVSLFMFAWLPPTRILPQEWLAMVLSLLAFIGVVANAIPRVRLPGERYAYIITVWVGLYVLAAYARLSTDPTYMKITMVSFLTSGIASAYAAHVIDGGVRELFPDEC